jgi:uncharacterized DUF497 family protein
MLTSAGPRKIAYLGTFLLRQQSSMEIEFDPDKSAKNEKERALPFELVRELEWEKARISRDERHDYGEERFVGFVPKDGRLYVVCFCLRETTTKGYQLPQGKKERGEGLWQNP